MPAADRRRPLYAVVKGQSSGERILLRTSLAPYDEGFPANMRNAHGKLNRETCDTVFEQ